MENSTYWIAGVIALLAAFAEPAYAGSETMPSNVEIPAERMQCAFNAWTSFRTSAPIAVFAKPDKAAKVLGYLPVSGRGDDDDATSIELNVVEAERGWLKIGNATDPVETDENGQLPPSRAFYQGSGWVSGEFVQVGIQSALGYERPNAGSAVLVDFGTDWLTEVADILAIRGCSAQWLLIEYRVRSVNGTSQASQQTGVVDRKTGRAWFQGICENQFTTCDMKSVDRRKENGQEK